MRCLKGLIETGEMVKRLETSEMFERVEALEMFEMSRLRHLDA